MFVQVITAKVTDADAVRRQMVAWEENLAGGARGWLGFTGGITDDGRLIQAVRFDSEEAARANADRPEQGEWWTQTERALEGAQFVDSDDVAMFLEGGSDDAGFVQVMQGRLADRGRFDELMQEMESTLPQARPDLIGGLAVHHGDGGITLVNYFTSEDEARQREAAGPPDDQRERVEEWRSLFEDLSFYDISNPWLGRP